MAGDDKIFYDIRIELDKRMMNERAADVVPALIREFAQTCKIKLSLVTSTQSFSFDATVEQGPDYTTQPLFSPEELSDGNEDIY